MKILVLNAGSSSIKFQLFDMPSGQVALAGLVEQIGEAKGRITYILNREASKGRKHSENAVFKDHKSGLKKIAALIQDPGLQVIKNMADLKAVGHRVVHGGEKYSAPTVVNNDVFKDLQALSFLAPLHNPANLKGIEVASSVFPEAKQVAVFDTAFHQTIPDFAYRFAIPASYHEEHGIRAYGFHGTSHAFVSKAAADFLNCPLENFNAITIHLGNGCSMAAIKEGKSVDVSMGLTPLGGLIMGTRSGDIDPSVIFFLEDHLKMGTKQINQLLNKESGLKGLTGENDLRNVQKLFQEGDPKAELALKMYVYRIKKYIGAYLAILGSIDAIIFTAGVGENSALIRRLACEHLDHLGICLDQKANEKHEGGLRNLSAKTSTVQVLVVPTNEELEIASQSYELVLGLDDPTLGSP
ncbi:MAG: acetate kinase [Bacteroidota bacterium]